MHKRRIQIPFLILAILSIGGMILTACASEVLADSSGDFEAQVNTAVAATMIQVAVETKVAAQSLAMAPVQVAQTLPTSTPLPTVTPVPTESVAPTASQPAPTAAEAAASTSYPKIYADQNTNCRVGPSTYHYVSGYFMAGDTSFVHGRDTTKDWWYIEHPTKSGEFCWVWDGSTTVEGDTSKVPVVDAPAASTTKTSNVFDEYYVYDPYYGIYNPYGKYPPNGYYPNKCWTNVNCGKYPKCCNNQQTCIPINWGNCNSVYTCNCNWVNKNSCKKPACPPVTEINFQNYCNKYPNCCK